MNKKWYLFLALTMLLCFSFTLPAVGAEGNSLVTVDELNSLLGTDGVVIIDVRDTAAYEAGHIPGAVSIQQDDYYETINGVKSMAASPELFSATLSRIGADNNCRIIVYAADANDLKYATRCWWVLHMYGHQNTQVLDGGISAWTAEGYELSTQPAVPTPGEYTLTADNLNPNTLATTEEVFAAQAANEIIVDARDDSYFQGQKTKTARSGHIKGAVLINEKENLNEDGTFKTPEELAQIYAARKINSDTPVITYCNTGTTSTVDYFALTQILGYTHVQNYDGSLTAWAAEPTLPMDSNYGFFTIGSDKAEVRGDMSQLPAAPCLQDNRSFIAADTLAASLGAQLNIEGEKITLSTDNINLQLALSDTTLKINGTEKQMDTAPFTTDGINFLPIRWAAEAFGAEVCWDAENQLVTVGLLQ